MSKKKKPLSPSVGPAVILHPWIFPTAFVGPIFLVWGLVVYYFYITTHPFDLRYLPWFVDQLNSARFFNAYGLKIIKSIAVCSAISGVAWEGGRRLLTALWPDEAFSGVEASALGGALGVGVLVAVISLMGALRLWYVSLLAGVLLVMIIGLAVLHQRGYPLPKIVFPKGDKLWIGLLALFFVIFFLGELTPETFYDALYYHIAVPDLYRIAHRIYDIPTMLFSNFVLTIQMFFGWALTLGPVISAKLLHGFLGLLLVTAFLALEGPALSSGAGWLAALIFFSMPITGLNIVSTGTDVGWAFLHVASAVALVRALAKPSTRSWIMAGVFTGLSAGCKYPGFPYIPMAGIVLVWSRRRDDHAPWAILAEEALLFLSVATAAVLPILIRNVIFHGNPLYPFAGTIWGTPRITSAHWQIFISDANSRVMHDVFHSRAALIQFLFHPWLNAMQGQSNSDFIGPLYLLMLPLLFLFRSPRPGFAVLRRYTGLLWILWMLTTQSPRYGLPALALAAVLMAEAVYAGFARKPWRWIGTGFVLVGVLSNLNYAAIFSIGHEGWRVVAGEMTENDLLSEMRQGYPTPPYDGIIWMNTHLPANSKILYAGEARSYYTELPVVPSSVPDPQPLVAWSEESADGNALANRFRAEGVTHIFLNYMEATRTESYHLFAWDAAGWRAFQAFWAHDVQLVWKAERLVQGNPKGLYVYAILPESEAAQPHIAPPNPFQRWAPNAVHS